MVRIRECGEPLVDVRKACPGVVIDLGKERMRKEQTAYLRKTVAEMVARAKTYIPKGMTFIVRDAWRTQEVQRNIFESFIERFEERNPEASREEIIRQVKTLVAPWDGPFVSDHMTGAAVDIRIIVDGKRLPMRSWDLPYEENARSRPKKLPNYLMRNREIMYDALTRAGLSNYPKEFWHWSYGDAWWAKRKKRKTAIYGIVHDPFVQEVM